MDFFRQDMRPRRFPEAGVAIPAGGEDTPSYTTVPLTPKLITVRTSRSAFTQVIQAGSELLKPQLLDLTRLR